MSDTEVLLPVHHKKGSRIMSIIKKKAFFSFKISFPRFGWLSISLSLGSFFFCIIRSIVYNFEEANATHCSVENYFPSISAAIGNFYPQIYIWNATMLIQMLPRLKVSTMYFHYFASIIDDKYFNLCYLVRILNMCELWSLLGLSLITSTTNYNFHAFCFVLFLFGSMFYMILSCYLLKFKRKIPPGNTDLRILKWKLKWCSTNIFCFLMAGYFFRRHNLYCEPRVYSIFALFEYGVVVSNILFHLAAIWDFHDKIVTLAFSWRGIRFSYNPPFKSVPGNFK